MHLVIVDFLCTSLSFGAQTPEVSSVWRLGRAMCRLVKRSPALLVGLSALLPLPDHVLSTTTEPCTDQPVLWRPRWQPATDQGHFDQGIV